MKVAVCICTCERPAGIDRLLTALENIDLAGLTIDQMEIVVVDNRPDGRARAICAEHEPRLGIPLHFCEEHERGISFARNRAVREALDRGADFIAFLDDDDTPRSDWLLKLLEKQRETGAEIVMGTWRLPDDFRAARHLARVDSLNQPEYWDEPSHFGVQCCGCNVVIGREAIELLGEPPYRPEFALTGGEDIDFFMRAEKAGAQLVQARDSVVIKDPGAARATLRGVLRQAFWSGSNKIRLSIEHMPVERSAKLRRRLPKRLAKSIGRLSPFSLPTSVAALEEMATVIGEIYGAMGGRYAYYERGSRPWNPTRHDRI